MRREIMGTVYLSLKKEQQELDILSPEFPEFQNYPLPSCPQNYAHFLVDE